MLEQACPWCREALSSGDWASGFCPHCEREIVDGEGRELRALDLRYERLEEELRRRLRKLLVVGTPIALLLGFLLPWLHVAVVFLLPAMLLAHLATVRLYLQGVGRPYYGLGRSFTTRWMTRLVFLWIGGPLYGLAVIPVLGAAISGLSFAGLSFLAVLYEQRNLRREIERRPLAGWEKVVLALLSALTLALVLAVLIGALLLGLTVQTLIGLLQK